MLKITQLGKSHATKAIGDQSEDTEAIGDQSEDTEAKIPKP